MSIMVGITKNERRAVREVRADVLASYQSKDESGGINYGLYIQHKESLFRKRNSVG